MLFLLSILSVATASIMQSRSLQCGVAASSFNVVLASKGADTPGGCGPGFTDTGGGCQCMGATINGKCVQNAFLKKALNGNNGIPKTTLSKFSDNAKKTQQAAKKAQDLGSALPGVKEAIEVPDVAKDASNDLPTVNGTLKLGTVFTESRGQINGQFVGAGNRSPGQQCNPGAGQCSCSTCKQTNRRRRRPNFSCGKCNVGVNQNGQVGFVRDRPTPITIVHNDRSVSRGQIAGVNANGVALLGPGQQCVPGLKQCRCSQCQQTNRRRRRKKFGCGQCVVVPGGFSTVPTTRVFNQDGDEEESRSDPTIILGLGVIVAVAGLVALFVALRHSRSQNELPLVPAIKAIAL